MRQYRIGRVTVATQMLRKAIASGDGSNLFVGFVPLDVVRDFLRDTTTFTGWHADFDQIAEGEIPPEYVATFAEGSCAPTWSRKQ